MVFKKGTIYHCSVALLCACTLVVASEASLSLHSENLVRMFRDYLTTTEKSLDLRTRKIFVPLKRQTEAYKIQNFAIWYDPNSGMKICERNITKESLECLDGPNNCKYMNNELNICKSRDAAKTLGCLKTCDLCNDKCTSGQHNCHNLADCITDKNSFSCKCKKGYTGDGVNNCKDVDECVSNTHTCLSNQNCINEIGSYRCETNRSEAISNNKSVCTTGYIPNTKGQCVDKNECELVNRCDKFAYCKNTPGSYMCTCKRGFFGSGSFCADINECNSANSCHDNAKCINEDGSYSCECKTGYTGDGYRCIDYDECRLDNPCHKHATCKNTEGSYSCKCKSGFEGNGKHCTDIDECKTKPCDRNRSKCKNTPGSYTCVCNNGYQKKGNVCVVKIARQRWRW